jgi:hypothetical protein
MRQLVTETDRPIKRRFYQWLLRWTERAHRSSTDKVAKAERKELR